MDHTVVEIITNFVESIGLSVIRRTIEQDTFLPGLLLETGNIIVDPDKLLYPGDILHEAGHLAAYPPGTRETIGDPLPEYMAGGIEMMALAWSYAACLYIGLEPKIVFHEHGYKGQSAFLLQSFGSGTYIGLNMLQWMGMAYDEKNARQLNVPPYPHMVSWYRTTLID